MHRSESHCIEEVERHLAGQGKVPPTEHNATAVESQVIGPLRPDEKTAEVPSGGVGTVIPGALHDSPLQ